MSIPHHHIDLLKQAFKPLDLSPETHPDFFNMWQEVRFDRHSFMTEAGMTEQSLYVVIEGVQCMYILDQQGEKQVIGFSFHGSFSGVYDSFAKQMPSACFLESLTPSRLLRINPEQYHSLFNLYPEFGHWGRVVHLDILVGRVQREIELITKTAAERFRIFMDRCPDELKTIPQKYLASYLNMTPETFSRLRKKSMGEIS